MQKLAVGGRAEFVAIRHLKRRKSGVVFNPFVIKAGSSFSIG